LEDEHWWFLAWRKMLRSLIDRKMEYPLNAVLDVGCAGGATLRNVFHDVPLRYGIDAVEKLLSKARKDVPSAKFINQDINLMESFSSKFDLIFILDVLSHNSIRDKNRILLKLRDSLREEGYLLIADGAFNCLKGDHSRVVDGGKRFTIKELKCMLTKNNFEIVYSQYWGISLFFPLFVKRAIFERFFRKNSPSTDMKKSGKLVNNTVYYIMVLESMLFRYVKSPFGSSVILLAKRKN
jgi:SAM-dependent methyltransferase